MRGEKQLWHYFNLLFVIEHLAPPSQPDGKIEALSSDHLCMENFNRKIKAQNKNYL